MGRKQGEMGGYGRGLFMYNVLKGLASLDFHG